jgi:starch phosphorylase
MRVNPLLSRPYPFFVTGTKMTTTSEILHRLECPSFQFDGSPDGAYHRHLLYDNAIDPTHSHSRQKFEALARAVRDLLIPRWLKTRAAHNAANPKRAYYLSMEFLIGRSLMNNITNLTAEPLVRELMAREKLTLNDLIEMEPDAGLGNGGLGRLAACFLDSMATLNLPATGYGLRYQYGIFKQDVKNGYQAEQPDNWLLRPDPWEIPRPEEALTVRLNTRFELRNGQTHVIPGQPMDLFAVPYDRPVVGYKARTVNTLRLWAASTPGYFDFGEFSSGDFFAAVSDKVVAETVTRVLYPDDSTTSGRSLRFIQEYFLVSCAIQDILRRFRTHNDDWSTLPDKVAIQLNDTHPAMAVSEVMIHLIDRIGLGWDQAWDITQRTLAYTNHTLLPEALEKWPVEMFASLIPRHLEVIYEINRRFLDEVKDRYPDEPERLARMSVIEEGTTRRVRMAHLAIIGSHSTNGVAAIHSELLRKTTVKDFAEMYPERFNNKTNGVTPRRWLLAANPPLASLLTEAVGPEWVTHLDQLEAIKPMASDAAFREKFRKAKHQSKEAFARWLKSSFGVIVDPDFIFDSQIKRIHEYKRQLLNLLHVVMLYYRLKHDSRLQLPPRVFFFSGKAAPAYTLAKNIIKLINTVAATIDADAAMKGKLKVVFLPNYSVSIAERLIPASDVSEQISTAGYEASGTGNMKFMMNGALTIGTRDGATIEMAQAAGEENFFLFGLNVDEVKASRGWYNPMWHYQHEPLIRATLDLIFSDHFNPTEPGIFAPIRHTLIEKGDYYMHLADLTAYAKAQQAVGELYAHPEEWTRKAILNVGSSGFFSTDRTIGQYAEEIWKVKPVGVE